MDYRFNMKNEQYHHSPQQSFVRPKDFEKSLIEVKNHIQDALQNSHPAPGNSMYYFNENSRLSDILGGDVLFPTNLGPGGSGRESN
jgi:hypothetical protein